MKKRIPLTRIGQIVMLPGMAILVGNFIWFRLLKHPVPAREDIGPGFIVAMLLMPLSLMCGSMLIVVHHAAQYFKKRNENNHSTQQGAEGDGPKPAP
jgi:hypothetical protein